DHVLPVASDCELGVGVGISAAPCDLRRRVLPAWRQRQPEVRSRMGDVAHQSLESSVRVAAEFTPALYCTQQSSSRGEPFSSACSLNWDTLPVTVNCRSSMGAVAPMKDWSVKISETGRPAGEAHVTGFTSRQNGFGRVNATLNLASGFAAELSGVMTASTSASHCR